MAREHRYESCRDADCPRPYCRLWKLAREEFYNQGFADGVAAAMASMRQS